MKYLFSTGCLYHLPIEEIFVLAREGGFDGCELVIDQHFMSDGYLDRVQACLDILPFSASMPLSQDEEVGTKMEELKRSIDIARVLGQALSISIPPRG